MAVTVTAHEDCARMSLSRAPMPSGYQLLGGSVRETLMSFPQCRHHQRNCRHTPIERCNVLKSLPVEIENTSCVSNEILHRRRR